MIVCPRCGERLPEGFTRCDACGAYLVVMPAAGSGPGASAGAGPRGGPGASAGPGARGGSPAGRHAPKGRPDAKHGSAPRRKTLGLSNSTWVMIIVGLLIGGAIGFALKSSIAPRGQSGMPAGPADVMAGASGGGMPAAGGAMPADIMAEVQKDRAILEKNPDDVSANVDLGNLLFDSGQWEKATEHYGRALAKEPNNPDVRVDMAVAFHNLGQDQRARQEMERVTREHPDHRNAWLNLGVVTSSMGDNKAAIAAWEQYLKLDPTGEHAASIRDEVARLKQGR